MCGRYWRSHGAPSGSPFLSLSGDFWVLDWLSRRWCRWDFLDLEGKEGRQRLFLELPCAWTTATHPFLFHLLFHALWDRVPWNLDWPGTSRIFLSSWSSCWNCRCHHCALFGASLFPVEEGCRNRKTIGLKVTKNQVQIQTIHFTKGKNGITIIIIMPIESLLWIG